MDAATALADDIALTETLRFAVPELVNDLLARPAADLATTAQWWSTDAARAVGERGDLLIFRSNTQWKPARANTFNRLARGLAAAVVLHPGEGVDVAGLHWCLRRDCRHCNPPRVQPAMTGAEIRAQLEALDADYRALSGLPSWTSPASTEQPPALDANPDEQPTRPATTITPSEAYL